MNSYFKFIKKLISLFDATAKVLESKFKEVETSLPVPQKKKKKAQITLNKHGIKSAYAIYNHIYETQDGYLKESTTIKSHGCPSPMI